MTALSAIAAAVALAALAASPVLADPTFPTRPTPTQIGASIDRFGAHATVSALFDQGRWDYVADEIGDGGSAWVALAVRLAPGADAGTAEELPISLAFALPINPAAVLATLPSGAFDVADVCGAPFIEGTVRDLPAYLRKASDAVEKVTDPTLKDQKTACLEALAAATR
jgi:hypothetical protein